MNDPLLMLPLSSSTPDEVKKKRVLRIEASHTKRDLCAEALRRLGIDVDSAADIADARDSSLRAVLINMEKGKGLRDRFCDDLPPPRRDSV